MIWLIWLTVGLVVVLAIVTGICMDGLQDAQEQIISLSRDIEATRRYLNTRDEIARQRIFTIHDYLGVSEGVIERKDVLVKKHSVGRG